MPSKKLIQIGVGGMGLVWTDCVAASKRWQAASYVDTNSKNLEAAARRHKLADRFCFESLDDALGCIEADAVLDVTPQQFRRGVCIKAFDAGLGVLSEKPLADTMQNAVAIVLHALELGRTYMVAQNYRYQPVVQAAKRFIASGKLGDVGYVGVQFHKGPHFGGFREAMPFPLLLDMSIHHFDMMRCMLGDDVNAVQGVSTDASWNWNKGSATASLQVEMHSGVVVNYHASWVAQGWETEWNADWRFDGSKGVLLLEKDQLFFSNSCDERRPVTLPKMTKTHQAHLLDVFAKALDSGEEPETSGRRNLNSLATTHAAVRAVKNHRRVRVGELLVGAP